MKKTVWDIDEDLSLQYHHSGDDIRIVQDTRHANGGGLYEIYLSPGEVSELIDALWELKGLLEAEKTEKTLGEVA